MPKTFKSSEVADYLGISLDTLYNWIKTEYLPSKYVIRFMKFYRFDPSIMEWRPGE